MKWVSKILDVPKLIRRIWLILWITLFLLVLMKFLFNKWYPIVVDNETLMNLFYFIDSKSYIKYIIAIVLYIINLNIWFMTNIKQMKYSKINHFIMINILIVISYFMKCYMNILGVLFEVIILVVIPIILNLKRGKFDNFVFFKWRIKRAINVVIPIVIYLLLNLWQMNILFIRDIDTILTNLPSMFYVVLQHDYYIFTIITWIGVNYFMGIFGAGWFWGKSITELKAMREKEMQKAEPDLTYIKQIDEAIAKKENEIKD